MYQEQFLRSLAITFLLVAIVMPAGSEAQYRSNMNMNAAEMEQFHDFLNSHPWFRTDLSKNPALVDDANYLRQHSELSTFLQSHPAIRQELKTNPRLFWQREMRYESAKYGEQQPGMQSALRSMRDAQHYLETGASDKGGHRLKALELLKQAEAEVQAGIEYANTH
jgi:hypothetical protein